MSELLMPPYPNGSVQQQLTQQYSYLFQMAQQLNMALSALEGGTVSNGSGSGQQRKSGGAAAAAGKAAASQESRQRDRICQFIVDGMIRRSKLETQFSILIFSRKFHLPFSCAGMKLIYFHSPAAYELNFHGKGFCDNRSLTKIINLTFYEIRLNGTVGGIGNSRHQYPAGIAQHRTVQRNH